MTRTLISFLAVARRTLTGILSLIRHVSLQIIREGIIPAAAPSTQRRSHIGRFLGGVS